MDFKKLVKTLHLTFSALTLASTILLLISFIFSFDMINGYFIDGVFPTLFKIFYTVGIILSLVSISKFNKKNIIKTENFTSKQTVIYAVCGVILVLSSQILNYFVTNKYFALAMMGLGFFALFVIACATKNGYEYSHLKLLCLLLSALFPIPIVIDNNAVMVRHSNSAENTLTSVFAIAFLIYILYEGKRIFTKEHSRWHFASMLLLTHTGLSLSISYSIVYLMGIATETTRFYQMISIFLVSVFVEIELIRFSKLAKSHTKEEWEEIEAPEEPTEEPPAEENTETEKTDE